jgi:hypothetical protein
MTAQQLTVKESQAIERLKRLAKKWPSTLWLFSASGTLCVMKKGADGNAAMTDSGGVDQDYLVDSIRGIDNDGGDW